MESLVTLMTVTMLVFGAGAVLGAELEDRITEARRRRVAARQREVNEAIRWIKAAAVLTTYPAVGRGPAFGVSFHDPDVYPAPTGGRPTGRR